jgi:hypothetical protein
MTDYSKFYKAHGPDTCFCEEYKDIIRDLLWMARRYADKRSTYAPHTVNLAIDMLILLGHKVEPDANGNLYADDGMFGQWNPKTQTFTKEGESDD